MKVWYFVHSILDNLNSKLASITNTHDKDIEEVTETMCDVATRLDSIQNGRYILQLKKCHWVFKLCFFSRE